MKKKNFMLPLVFAMFLGLTSGYAQIYVGPTAGVGFSTVTTKDRPDDLGLLLSQRLGASVQIPFKSYFSFRVDGRWSSQGYSSRVTFTDENGSPIGDRKIKDRLNYLQFQTHVRFEFEFIYISIGPYVGFLTSATRIYPKELNPSTIGNEFDVKETYDTFDMGIASAFGFLVNLSEGMRLELGIQNTNGFLNTLKENASLLDNSRNFDFGLTVGLQIQLGNESKG